MALIGNKVTEKDLRDHLTALGYCGDSARFLRLELAGIERPGWVQLFEFHVQVRRHEAAREDLFGVCRCDERDGTFEVQLQGTPQAQQSVLEQETQTMLRAERRPRHPLEWVLLLIFAAAVIVALISAILS